MLWSISLGVSCRARTLSAHLVLLFLLISGPLCSPALHEGPPRTHTHTAGTCVVCVCVCVGFCHICVNFHLPYCAVCQRSLTSMGNDFFPPSTQLFVFGSFAYGQNTDLLRVVQFSSVRGWPNDYNRQPQSVVTCHV